MIINKVLVIVAHPDDEVIGMGGTIARLVDEGHEVQVLYLTGGETSSGVGRFPETEEVGRILGITGRSFLHIPDQQLDTYAQSSINNMISQKIQSIKPNIVYTHAKEDLNIDHRITHGSVMVACRPTPDCSVTELYTFCVSQWDFGEFGGFQPNTFVNINPYASQKLEAMTIYSSEIKEEPHPQSLFNIKYDDVTKGAKFCLWEVEEFQQVFRLI